MYMDRAVWLAAIRPDTQRCIGIFRDFLRICGTEWDAATLQGYGSNSHTITFQVHYVQIGQQSSHKGCFLITYVLIKCTGTQDQYTHGTSYPLDRHPSNSAAALVGPLFPISVILSVYWEYSIPRSVLPQVSPPPSTPPPPGVSGRRTNSMSP